MSQLEGITHDGLKTALKIKDDYENGEPICVPGEGTRILMPEYLMNHHLDLQVIDDPLALAMMATRDPEAPMALAAATRLSPLGASSKLLGGIYDIVGDTSKHPLVKKCISLVTENAFDPEAIASVRSKASSFIDHSRREYSVALRRNLQTLLDGTIAPREFVKQFFELTEAGNMRSEIRRKLVSSLLLSESIRPSIKFLFLENLERFPKSVRSEIITSVRDAESSHHTRMIKEEMKWITAQEKLPADMQKKPEKKPSAVVASPVVNVEPLGPKPKITPRPWRPGEGAVPKAVVSSEMPLH
ncbi:MAG: hypothetical protein HN360_06580 [Rhodospirillaceae bacterium]|nr:hypothetical protein [Rhodospirillaceae bacterium]